jgi:hypothetical protein
MEKRPGLALLDPIMGFASEDIQTHNDASIRRMLGPLADVASEHGCAILGIRHLKKDQREENPLYRGGGSIAIGGAARSVLLVGKMPNDETDTERVLAPVKNNLARRAGVPSLRFQVDSWERDPSIPVVSWLGETPISAADLLRSTDSRTHAPARAHAERVIREVLQSGPLPVKAFDVELRAAGVKSDTGRAAAQSIGVHRWRTRDDLGRTKQWCVHLPEQPCPPDCREVFVKGKTT